MNLNISLNKDKSKERSKQYKTNIVYMLIFQSISICTSFLLVPITLKYLGINNYGIWITLTTLIGWFSFFDIGLGHGLRNKYAESKAQNNYIEIRRYISTSLFILIAISLIIFILFSIVAIFVDWSNVLAAPEYLSFDLKILAFIIALTFCIRFVVNIVCVLLTADQQPYIPYFLNLCSNILSLIGVYILTITTKSSILSIGICLSVTQIIPISIGYVYFFNTKYKTVYPSFKYFSTNHIRPLFSLGIQFFIIQITSLVLFQTNNIIIAHTCGQQNVTEFNIAYKYINIIYITFSTLLTPLWSASTEAFVKGDITWIKKCMRKLKTIWLYICLGGLLLIILSPYSYKLWLKNAVSPNYFLLILILLYFITMMRSSMYRFFMNGVGKIRLQFYVTLIQSLIHIPLAIILGQEWGILGVVFTMFIWSLINSIWEPIQFKRIIEGKALGIWNK